VRYYAIGFFRSTPGALTLLLDTAIRDGRNPQRSALPTNCASRTLISLLSILRLFFSRRDERMTFEVRE
jgi:hypothetical protein